MPDTALELDGFPDAGIGLLRNPRLGKDKTYPRADLLRRKELPPWYEQASSPVVDQPARADHAQDIFATLRPLHGWFIELED